jgi:hypothetical protein
MLLRIVLGYATECFKPDMAGLMMMLSPGGVFVMPAHQLEVTNLSYLAALALTPAGHAVLYDMIGWLVRVGLGKSGLPGMAWN